MVEIRGGSAKENIAREFYFSEAEAPNMVINSVQPVFEVGEVIHNIVRTNPTVASNNTQTIFTTPADKDFFLTNASISGVPAIAAGSAYITLTIGGATQNILRIALDTGTPTSNSQGGPMNILVDRNTNITITSSAAGLVAWGSIVGYTKESIKKNA